MQAGSSGCVAVQLGTPADREARAARLSAAERQRWPQAVGAGG